MTNIHFLECINSSDDIIQTHVLLQLQEETDMASRLILISYLEMECPAIGVGYSEAQHFRKPMGAGRSESCLFFYVGF